ncbi:GNAT family N-acetyltransferase [Labrenzia sp. DG1229]|uniref:GNAT family N-acetyltransferase n=1 Tax=Labrenzia sp. DG1229 TaxID=681847 RepID=UPI000A40AF5D|nr:GNAT family N-acetyltransferase [Labrenzia sp. DG1229]
MSVSIVDAKAEHPARPIADLIWTVDKPLMTFLFGTRDRWRRVFACDWPESKGIVCHKQMTLAVRNEEILGVLISHTLEEFDEHFIHTRLREGRNEGAEFHKHLNHAFDMMAQLFPHGLEGSYFVFDLTISSKARRLGIGRQLLDVAKSKAKEANCDRVCLDVAADNDAVQFYNRMGMQVAVETRIPELADRHGV